MVSVAQYMPHSHRSRRDSRRSSLQTEPTEDESDVRVETATKVKRTATVYDAVAGKVGLQGFLTESQLQSSNILPSTPEEVLLRRVTAPDEIPYGFYAADETLTAGQRLPDSEVLKAVHAYVSDYFAATTAEQGGKDFRSFDGTALLALGVLLEEAAKEAMGVNGDMVLVEPAGLENGLPESKMSKHQITGRVKPRKLHKQNSEPSSDNNGTSDSVEEEQSPRKRRRART